MNISNAVTGFIPLFYVAWVDGMLSPSEIALIKSKIEEATYLTEEDKKLLYSWLNTDEWPEEKTFRSWVQLIRKTTSSPQYEPIDSIVELGLQMAQKSLVGDAKVNQQMDDLQNTLEGIESEMDIPSLQKFSNLLLDKQVIPKPGTITARDIQMALNGRHQKVIQEIKSLLMDPVFGKKDHRSKEDYREQVLSWTKILAQHGYGAIAYPKEYGGKGSMAEYAAVFETIAHFDLSLTVKFGVQFGLFGGALYGLGTKKHHDLYLSKTGQLDIAGCFAMTETGHGSNVRDLETTGTYNHEQKTITVHSPSFSAGKEYIGNAMHARVAIVFCQLIVGKENRGVHAVLVPLRNEKHQILPGITIQDNGYKIGLNGVDNGRIWFNQVDVPAENLLDRFGSIDDQGHYSSEISSTGKRFFSMLGTLVGGRICVGKAANSAAKSAISIAIKYALKRRQFQDGNKDEERLIIHYPTHQARLIPALGRIYATHFALDSLMTDYDNRSDDRLRQIETEAAALKAYATRGCTDIIQECREACGGKGYLWENRLGELKADSDIFTTFEGDNTVLLQLVAKGLLSEFKEEFSDEGILGVWKVVSKRMNQSFIKINPIQKRKTDTAHLLDSTFHLQAFEFRQESLLLSVATRLRSMIRKRISPFDAFLRCQNHMVELGQAYAEYLVLQAFTKRIDSLQTGKVRSVLTKLQQLHALHTIYENRGWYLEKEYIHGNKSNAIRRQIERICWDLVPEVNVLVDGFGIPNAMLGAPIALQKES